MAGVPTSAATESDQKIFKKATGHLNKVAWNGVWRTLGRAQDCQ
jgi:hypothetical protein